MYAKSVVPDNVFKSLAWVSLELNHDHCRQSDTSTLTIATTRQTRKYTHEIEKIKITPSLSLLKGKSKLVEHMKHRNCRYRTRNA